MQPLVESADLKEIKTCLKRPRAQNDIQVFSGSHSFSDGQAVHPAEVGFLLVLASMLRLPASYVAQRPHGDVMRCLYTGHPHLLDLLGHG